MKKICFLNNYFEISPGGAEYQTWLYSSLLSQENFETSFIHFGSEFPEGQYKYGKNKVYCKHYPKLMPSRMGDVQFLLWPTIKKLLDELLPDVVICLGGYSYIGFVATYRKRTYDFIWICASNKDLQNKRFNFARPFDFFGDVFRFKGIKNATRCYVQSSDQKIIYNKLFNHRNIDIFMNIQPLPLDPQPKRFDHIKIVWIANLKKLKQPELFIELAKRCQHLKKVEFIMIGNSSDSMLYQQKIENLMKGISNFSYLGRLPQNQVNEILNLSHILINTSTHEGFSNVFVQAWMRCLPVISLNEDPDTLLSKHGLGFYSKGNFDTMVKQLEMLVGDLNLLKEMGNRARDYALNNHSLEKGFPILMEIVNNSSN